MGKGISITMKILDLISTKRNMHIVNMDKKKSGGINRILSLGTTNCGFFFSLFIVLPHLLNILLSQKRKTHLKNGMVKGKSCVLRVNVAPHF